MDDIDELLPRAERVEAEAACSWTAAATPETARACGLRLRVDRGVVGAFASHADVLALNRVMGFSSPHPPSAEDIAGWVAFARQAGVPRFFVQIAPIPEAPAIAALVQAAGGRLYNGWRRLARRLDQTVPALHATPYRIDELESHDRAAAHAFASVVIEAFHEPDVVRPWIAEMVGKPGWRHYAAMDGDRVMASAAMYLTGTSAWFGYAATRAEARGRGAQSALIARRIADARAGGAEWAFLETAEETPARRAQSYHNVRRLGFRDLYRRENYLFDLREEGGV